MPQNNKLNGAIDLMFLLIGGWWVSLLARNLTSGSENYAFNLIYALFACIGGIILILQSKEWGWSKSLYGKFLLFLGSAVILWSNGGFIWAYYNFTGQSDVPFPSLADHVGFAWFYPLTCIALIFLVKGIGFKYAWKKTNIGKILLVAVPILATAITFYIYKDIRQSGSFQLEFYKYFYNIGGACILSASFVIMLLSKYFSGGKLKSAILFITIGVLMQYIADVAFNYRANPAVGIYYNADFTDMLYATSLYLIIVGGTMFTLKGKE